MIPFVFHHRGNYVSSEIGTLMRYLSSVGHMDLLVIAANNWMSTLTTDGNLPIL